MDYVQVLNGKIVRTRLPRTGKLKDGSTVSGYHLLDKEMLKSEGWLPVEEVKPDYNIVEETLRFAGYELKGNKVIRKYVSVDILKPSTEPQKVPVNINLADAYEAIAALNERLNALGVEQ